MQIPFLFSFCYTICLQIKHIYDNFRNGTNGREPLKMFDRFLNQLTEKLASVYKTFKPKLPTKKDFIELDSMEQDFISYFLIQQHNNVSKVRFINISSEIQQQKNNYQSYLHYLVFSPGIRKPKLIAVSCCKSILIQMKN